MKPALKTKAQIVFQKSLYYIVPLALNFLYFPFLPLIFLFIFLSGDSCCGENTSATMLIVTAVIDGLFILTSALLLALYKLILGKQRKNFSLALGVVIASLPITVVTTLFTLLVVFTAF